MPKDFRGEICNYFGIDNVEESLRYRQKKVINRYSGSIYPLCHLIFADADVLNIQLSIIVCLFCDTLFLYIFSLPSFNGE